MQISAEDTTTPDQVTTAFTLTESLSLLSDSILTPT